MSGRVLNRERPKELAGEDKENEPVRKVAAKEEAPAKPVLTEEEKERIPLRRAAGRGRARLNKVSEKDQPTGAVEGIRTTSASSAYRRTRVFCMTGWYPYAGCVGAGWHFNDDRESTFYDLKWTLRSNDIDKGIKPNQLTNHFLKNTAITTKAGLTRSLGELHWHCDDHSDHVYPRAYDLSSPHSFRGFLDDFRGLEAEKCLKNVIKSLAGAADGEESSSEDSSDSEVTDPLRRRRRSPSRSRPTTSPRRPRRRPSPRRRRRPTTRRTSIVWRWTNWMGCSGQGGAFIVQRGIVENCAAGLPEEAAGAS